MDQICLDDLFQIRPVITDCKKAKKEVYEISAYTAWSFLKDKHYSGRKPQISYAFGWYFDNILRAVCTFGKPASNSLCIGIMSDGQYSEKVYELNRLCRDDLLNCQLSQFVAECLRRLKPLNLIIVSYSDLAMHHNGYIYQALNFYFTGTTKERIDKFTEGNKHSRHYDNSNEHLAKVRTPKHRYIYFAGDKKFKKQCKKKMKLEILPYPKLQNKNYKLGEFQKQIIVSREEWGARKA